MDLHIGYIMTVSNSIIGVSILAMPYCFKQCGIVLAIVMLLTSGMISRLTCHYLLKSATMARRRTFELLSFHIFGTMGKLVVELGIIGFLMGTCVAFFVIIGDLGPAILAKVLDIENNYSLRTTMLIFVAFFCVLPLGLLKNVESLSSVSTATIGFYFCLVLKTIAESASHFAKDDWLSKVELWKPHGILQCLPIFAMALSCQTQLFEIYETLPNASLEKMNYVVRSAVNICICVYVCVGFFGYVAFANHPFTGNILMSFSPSVMTDAMKIGFVLSVACSFPLVIFPCRASLYSLLFRKGYAPYEGVNNFIPEIRFKLLTMFIVGVSLIVGIIIPNIEVVLGLLGSTIGTMICVIFPVTCFICISTKNTNERILAQIMLFVGVIMMVLGTYANLYAMEEIKTTPVHLERPLLHINPIMESQPRINNEGDKYMIDIKKGRIVKNPEPIEKSITIPTIIKSIQENLQEIRKEPPQPVEPYEEMQFKVQENKDIQEAKPENKEILPPEIKEKIKIPNDVKSTKTVEVDKAAIEKEDNMLKEEEKINKNNEIDKNNNANDILATLEKHKEEQKNLIQQQKEILEEIKKETKELKDKHLQDIQKDKEIRLKTANEIVEIAKKALESLGPNNDEIKNAEKIIESLSPKLQNNTQEKITPQNNDTKNKITESKSVTEKILANIDIPKLSSQKLVPLPILMLNATNSVKKVSENQENLVVKEIPLIDNTAPKVVQTKSKIIENTNKKEPEIADVKIGRDILEKSEAQITKGDISKTTVTEKVGRDILENSEAQTNRIVPNIVGDILNKNLVTEKIGRDILEKSESKTKSLEHIEKDVAMKKSDDINNSVKIVGDILEKTNQKIIERIKRDTDEKDDEEFENKYKTKLNKKDNNEKVMNEDCEATTKNKPVLSDVLPSLPHNVDILKNDKDILNNIKFTNTILKNHENLRRK